MMNKLVISAAIILMFFVTGVPAYATSHDVQIYIEEEKCVFDPEPYIREGSTMVSMRSFFEFMEAEVEWCTKNRAAVGYWNDKEVQIPNETTQPRVNGAKVEISRSSEIVDGRLFIPLRFAAGFFEQEVEWNADKRAVMLSNGAEHLATEQLDTDYEEDTVKEEKDEHSSSENYEATGNFIWPVEGGQVVSEYGPRGGRFHYGLDIGAEKGTPILASDSGKVVVSGWESSGYGYAVVIKHDDNYYTRYAHNARNLVSVGDYVSQGDIIAEIGATGNATCFHVHFEVRHGGKGGGNTDTHRDPAKYVIQD